MRPGRTLQFVDSTHGDVRDVCREQQESVREGGREQEVLLGLEPGWLQDKDMIQVVVIVAIAHSVTRVVVAVKQQLQRRKQAVVKHARSSRSSS